MLMKIMCFKLMFKSKIHMGKENSTIALMMSVIV